MNMCRFSAVALVACCAALVLAGTGTAASRAKPANTRVTIQAWPKGLFGYVSSPKPSRCADRRLIAVFKQQGRRQNPASDKRVARVRAAGKPGSYQWSTRRPRSGKFYAKVATKPGCRIAYSKTVFGASPVFGTSPGLTGGGAGGSFPPCSPYVSEGTSSICRFDLMHLSLNQIRPFVSCSFGRGEGDCPGAALTGPYPWGLSGFGFGKRRVSFFWNWDRNSVTFVAYLGQDGTGGNGIAHLGGVMPGPGSPEFTVRDGFAQNDRGYPNGDHFYTPDIPGQAAGEVGGPLHLNFVNGGPGDNGAEVYIYGYLYMKG